MDRGFCISIVEQLDGDYLRCSARYGSGGYKKLNTMFRPKSEFDLPDDPKMLDVHVEDPNQSWYHIAMTASTKELKMYINGEEKGTKKVHGNYLANKHNILVGSDGASKTLQGRMFDFYIFDQTLDQKAIESLMNEGAKRIPTIEEKIKEEDAELAEAEKKKKAPTKNQVDMQERIRRKMARRKQKKKG